MRLTSVDNNGFDKYFFRLIYSKPKDIFIYENCNLPKKSISDIYLYIPCDNLKHQNCGFFICSNIIKTKFQLSEDAKVMQECMHFSKSDMKNFMQNEFDNIYNIFVEGEEFSKKEIPKFIKKWLSSYVEELKRVPVKLIDEAEYVKIFSKYEEWHPKQEVFDMYYEAKKFQVENK